MENGIWLVLVQSECPFPPPPHTHTRTHTHTLTHHTQRTKGSRHRFSVIINELKVTDLPEYKACILGFVNYLISACADLDARLLLRAELNGRLVISSEF